MSRANSTTRTHKKLAFIIGNDNYQPSENKLNVCCNNANRMQQMLSKMEFQVTIHQNVRKRKKLVDHVNKWCEGIQENDLLLVYLSGHGLQLNGTNYFLLTNNDLEKEGDAQDVAMDTSRVIERIKERNKNNVTILILDCCRDYQFKDGNHSTGLTKMQPSARFLIQFACAENCTTRDNLFSECLLRNIGEEEEIRTLFGNIGDEVGKARNERKTPLLMYDGQSLRVPMYLSEPPEDLPNIPLNARWRRCAVTVFGGLGPGPMMKRLNNAKGIWIQKNRAILIADCANHRIVEYGSDRNKRKIAGGRVSGYGFSQLCYPTDVIFDESSQTFLVCDAHNRRVSRWSRGRKVCDGIIIQNIACYGIAMDRDGNIYVSDNEKHEVRRYAPGDHQGVIVAGGNGQGSRLHQLNGPTYICIGPKRSLYISDSDNNRVVRWDRDAKKGVVVAGGKGKGGNLWQLDYPTGIVVDRNGTLYVSDQRNNRIMRWYKGEGEGEKIIGGLRAGDSPSQINGPEGLRFDGRGNLYVVDSYNYRLQQFKIH